MGIDLGTTNCALAYAQTPTDPREEPQVQLMPIRQLIHPGEAGEESVLPSFLFLPGATDFPPGSLALPWDPQPSCVVGRLAQKRGMENAARLVSSAKSWLCHPGVDRESEILPPQAPEGVAKVSPIEASRQYLEHLRRAWDFQMPEAEFSRQQALVTVPASFDAVARELTQRAAQQAGYRDLILLEEPQAAFYAWIERHPDWRERVRPGDLILVIDVGGGTTDFSLMAVAEQEGELKLERLAVGEHILLGGDNMDLALARSTEQQLADSGTRLDAVQLHSLWQHCRTAKEKLLEEGSKAKEHPLTVLGRGTGLVGGTIRAKLRRPDLERILLDGFFPRVSSQEMPQRPRRIGLQEMGLPYAADAAVTRHLARFLRQPIEGELAAARRGASGLACPTQVLFNGGVLEARALRERLLEVLNGWMSQEKMPEATALASPDLMHAVARGAAYYGLARRGRGVRIRGGVARTYYVGIETAMPAVPGLPAPLKALVAAPFGMEEGSQLRIPDHEFALVVGEPAEFRFFSSSSRKNDPPGALLELAEAGELEELAPIQVCLPADGGPDERVPVSLETAVTEVGLLQVWCVARDGRRWKLEFNVRGQR